MQIYIHVPSLAAEANQCCFFAGFTRFRGLEMGRQFGPGRALPWLGRGAITRARRGVAQPGRAPSSGGGGRRFESSLPDQCIPALLAGRPSGRPDFVAPSFSQNPRQPFPPEPGRSEPAMARTSPPAYRENSCPTARRVWRRARGSVRRGRWPRESVP